MLQAEQKIIVPGEILIYLQNRNLNKGILKLYSGLEILCPVWLLKQS